MYVFDKIIIDMQTLDPPVLPLLIVLLDVFIAPIVNRNSEMFQKAWFGFLFYCNFSDKRLNKQSLKENYH